MVSKGHYKRKGVIKMNNEQKRFTLRMDSDLFETIKERAELNKRSIAKEIEHLLENYLKKEDNKDHDNA